MKNPINLLVLLILPLLTFAQSNTSLEIYIAPSYTDYNNKIIHDNFKGALAYNFGIGVNVSHNDKLTWTAGIRMADFSTKYSLDELRWGSQHDGMGGFDPELPSGEDLIGISHNSHYFFLEMPLGVKYTLSKKRFHLFLEPTINPAVFLSERSDIEYRYESKPNETRVESGSNSNIRKFNLFGELGFGFGFAVSSKISLHIRPSARIQVLSMVENSATGARFYSTGMKLGMNYQLR